MGGGTTERAGRGGPGRRGQTWCAFERAYFPNDEFEPREGTFEPIHVATEPHHLTSGEVLAGGSFGTVYSVRFGRVGATTPVEDEAEPGAGDGRAEEPGR